MPWTPPSSAKSLVFRPLLKGVIRNLPSQVISEDAFLTLDNYLVEANGIQRRSGFSAFAGGASVPYMMEDIMGYWSTTGNRHIVLLTDTSIYLIDPLVGFTESVNTYLTGTVSISGTVVTGVGTSWLTNTILPGDLLRVGGNEAEIVAIGSDTSLIIIAGTIPDQGGVAYSIQRTLRNSYLSYRDWTVIDGRLLIADGKHPIVQWEAQSNTVSAWTVGTDKMFGGIPFIPMCICSHMDRIWAANILNAQDGRQRQRIIWSNLADPHSFSTVTNYIEFPYLSGEIRRLIPMGPNLVAYFTDGIYMGSPTNYPLLPLRWDRVETGTVGLASSRGVAAFFGGHFFVGQDDVYFLGQNGVESIGTPIIREVLLRCQHPERTQCTLDVANSCLVIGFANDSNYLNELWYFNYKLKAWSRTPIQTSFIASSMIYNTRSWNSLTGTWDTLPEATWEDFSNSSSATEIYIESAQRIWKSIATAVNDFGTQTINSVLETKDFDFNDADLQKYVVRFGLKIDFATALNAAVAFNVDVSTNRGRSWENLGALIIPQGDDEGWINFTKVGSTIRFRLYSSSPTLPYTIVEYSLRVRGGGSELETGTSE